MISHNFVHHYQYFTGVARGGEGLEGPGMKSSTGADSTSSITTDHVAVETGQGLDRLEVPNKYELFLRNE